MSSYADNDEPLEFPSSSGGEGLGSESELDDIGEPEHKQDNRSSHRGTLGYTSTVMKPIMEFQEVEEESDSNHLGSEEPEVLMICVPALEGRLKTSLCGTTPAGKGSKVKPTKRPCDDPSTEDEESQVEVLPKKTKKVLKKAPVTKQPAKKKHKPTVAALSSHDELPTVPKQRVQPPKTVSEANTHFATSVFVEVAQAPTVQHGKSSMKDKFIRQAPKRAGPFELTERMGWERFLQEVVEIIGQEKENLEIASMSWSFQKKEIYPLTNAAGFKMMVTQVKSLKDPSSAIIVIGLPIPRSQQTIIHTPATMVEGVEGRLSGMTDESLYGKKLSVDASLAPIIEKLEERYPPGQCVRHPDVHCVAAPNRWHFDIDTARIKVWALAIVRKITDLQCMPLGTNHFLASQQIGASGGDKNFGPPQTPGPNPYAAHPPWNMGSGGHPLLYGLHQVYGSPLAYGSPMVFNQPQYPTVYSPSPGSYHPTHRSSHLVPAVPPPNFGNSNQQHKAVQDWCASKNLGEDEFNALVKLGYQVGDKFEVTELENCPEWTLFAFFTRCRILDAINVG